ncbi:G/U mismatch-specific uracil DNA glycosylase [Ceratocystis lukuohia]|uniref:G/U mismatch-specific uracil DNA glycosylase n=1 Tax=Ceratocystis lukuohia TaxID=2019550 RepID=A0ABR4MT74_9PEZI
MASPKAETEADGTDPNTASSFAGKLDLSSFIFTGTASQNPNLTESLPSPALAPVLVNRPKRVHSLSEQSQVSATLPVSSPPKKKKRKAIPASYAPPSQYAHLNLLPDAIDRGLIVLFVGLNPGIQTAHSGHAYAHPSNMFWKLLHSSGITPRRCRPEEDQDMPALYQLGLTNIVARPSRNGAELSKAEMDAGVEILEEKARKWRPEVMCIVGKSIWESIWRVRHGRGIRKSEFRYGWQRETENMGVIHKTQDEDEWRGAKVFVATSTSGLAATLRPAEKEQIWRELGEWVERRREERHEETE